jgi:hypothetical protein
MRVSRAKGWRDRSRDGGRHAETMGGAKPQFTKVVDQGAPNSGRERDSLMRAEISLIADLNSLQGCKKFPVRMRRELARKGLV